MRKQSVLRLFLLLTGGLPLISNDLNASSGYEIQGDEKQKKGIFIPLNGELLNNQTSSHGSTPPSGHSQLTADSSLDLLHNPIDVLQKYK